MREAIVGTLLGLVLGFAVAFLVHGVQPSSNCSSGSQLPSVGGGAVEPCRQKPALWPLVIGIGATGAAIGAVGGAARFSQRSRRNR